jgi:tRNA G18 (ribose-2'-O)-methylase SpoU
VIRVASLDDPRVAGYRHLADPAWLERAGLFVAEGRLVVTRLLRSNRFRTQSILVTDAAYDALRDPLIAASAAIPVYVTDRDTMNRVAGFNIHRGCLALAERMPTATLESLPLDSARCVLVLEGVNNPDNIGGIFRSAAAFDADAVILGPACSDPLYRKSVRTSMAATLAVPFVDAGAWPEALAVLRAYGLRVIGLTPAEDAPALDEVDLAGARVAILVGAEGDGLSAAAIEAADVRVRIPMPGPADSLNVTVAASIALYAYSSRNATSGSTRIARRAGR